VDGNDFFAVYNATKEARRIAVEQGKPVLIEAMTYRVGHHSTSDDWTKYRQSGEVDVWHKDNNPIYRLRVYLIEKGWWTEEQNNELLASVKAEIFAAVKKAQREKKTTCRSLIY